VLVVDVGHRHRSFQRGKSMVALKNVEYITDAKGNKKGVLLPFSDFDKLQEDLEDHENAIEKSPSTWCKEACRKSFGIWPAKPVKFGNGLYAA